MGTPRRKNVSSDIASDVEVYIIDVEDVEDSKSNEQILYVGS